MRGRAILRIHSEVPEGGPAAPVTAAPADWRPAEQVSGFACGGFSREETTGAHFEKLGRQDVCVRGTWVCCARSGDEDGTLPGHYCSGFPLVPHCVSSSCHLQFPCYSTFLIAVVSLCIFPRDGRVRPSSCKGSTWTLNCGEAILVCMGCYRRIVNALKFRCEPEVFQAPQCDSPFNQSSVPFSEALLEKYLSFINALLTFK